MTTQVLVPHDGSPLAEKAFEFACATFPDAEVVVLHVIDPVEAVYRAEGSGPLAGEAWYEEAKEQETDIFAAVTDRAEEVGVTVTTETSVDRPARAIIDYTREHDVDAVVMGTHGRSGVSRAILGSVAEKVVRRSPVPVTTVR